MKAKQAICHAKTKIPPTLKSIGGKLKVVIEGTTLFGVGL